MIEDSSPELIRLSTSFGEWKTEFKTWEFIVEENLWHIGAPFFYNQLIQKVALVLLKLSPL